MQVTALLLAAAVALQLGPPKRLTNVKDAYPMLSPDGTRVLFESDRTGDWEIYTMKPDGTDLVVEVLSPGTRRRDRTLKSKRYALFGVREMWIADPDAKTIEVFVNSGDGFQRDAIYIREDVLRSPLLPGLEIPLARVF